MANSLSTRLTYRIMAVVLAMVAIIAGLVYFTVRKYMLNEASERYLSILLENQQELRRRLSDVYVAARNNVHDIERDIDDPDKMFDHLERLVKINPNIVCSSLMFERNYYPSKGRVFIPCARIDQQGNVRKSEIDSTYHSFFYDEWFDEQLKKDETNWSKAYFEKCHHCDLPDAGEEHTRCVSCGTCRDCRMCVNSCPEKAITRIDDENGGWEYVSDPTKCIGCGICAGVCPCGIWSLKDNPEPIEMYRTYEKSGA